VVRLQVPPLRARREDVLPLARWFLDRQAALYGEPVRILSAEACAALQAYDWPGNVRELANAVEHACAFCEGPTIAVADLPETLRWTSRSAGSAAENELLTLEAAERLAISRALRVAKGNRAKAAQLLQIERHRLYRKIRLYRLEHLSESLAI